MLRFDGTGKADALPELLAEAGKRALKPEELKTLAEALRRHEPWLEWAGKRESDGEGRGFLEVDPVALHIHERVSAQAVLKVATRQDVARDLFADPEQEYRDAVQFYRHDVDWSNRLILGDSLQVMSSLARREGLAGKVQIIYIDPPYGIKFASNFQPEVRKRDVKDPIFAKHEPILDERLKAANAALAGVTEAIRTRLLTKLVEKQRAEGKRAVTDADRRRWELPKARGRWEHWQVPFDADPDWPEALRKAVEGNRGAWRAKMDEVNACISANAEREELVDQPEITRGIVR